MSVRIEWKKKDISREAINEEVYKFVENEMINYSSQPLSESYNDTRLIIREIVDNLYQHNTPNKIIVTFVISNSNHEVTISIYHDGEGFDPFNPINDCKLLVALDKQYKFNATFVPNSFSGNYELVLKIKLT